MIPNPCTASTTDPFVSQVILLQGNHKKCTFAEPFWIPQSFHSRAQWQVMLAKLTFCQEWQSVNWVAAVCEKVIYFCLCLTTALTHTRGYLFQNSCSVCRDKTEDTPRRPLSGVWCGRCFDWYLRDRVQNWQGHRENCYSGFQHVAVGEHIVRICPRSYWRWRPCLQGIYFL